MVKKTRRSSDSNGGQIKKTFHLKDLVAVRPMTDTQENLFDIWEDSPETSHFLCGSAGSGKTFLAAYMGLVDLLSKDTPYDNIVFIRSTVPTRDLGFLPGELHEKIEVYEQPYIEIFDQLFPWKNSYVNMKERGLVKFAPTSFLRGLTFDRSIIIMDECQSATFHELDTVMTRMGKHSKIIFCGDIKQNDLINRRHEKSGFTQFYNILLTMKRDFNILEFTNEDIVRSGMVKNYLIAKEKTLKFE